MSNSDESPNQHVARHNGGRGEAVQSQSQSVDQYRDFPDTLEGDFVLSYLRDTIRIDRPWRMGVLALMLAALRVLVIPILTGYFFPRSDIVSYLDTWWLLIGHLLVVPILVSVSMYQDVAVQRVFTGLRKEGVIVGPPAAFANLWGQLSRRYGARLWYVGIIGLMCVAYLWKIASRMNSQVTLLPSWEYPDAISYLAFQIPTFGFFQFVVYGMLARHIITVCGLITLFRPPFRLKLRLFHHDHLCGIAPLAEFCIRVAGVVAVAGFGLALLGLLVVSMGGRLSPGPLSPDTAIPVVLTLGYVVFAPVLFGAPLIAGWWRMRQAKRDLQRSISAEADEITSTLRSPNSLRGASMEDLADLATLGDLSAIIGTLPTFPMNLKQTGRALAYWLGPFVIRLAADTLPSLATRWRPGFK